MKLTPEQAVAVLDAMNTEDGKEMLADSVAVLVAVVPVEVEDAWCRAMERLKGRAAS